MILFTQVGVFYMKCKNCGFDYNFKKQDFCPACGTKIDKSQIPVWGVGLFIVSLILICLLPFISIIITLVFPSIMSNSDTVKNRIKFKKAVSSVNQFMMINRVAVDKTYPKFKYVWNVSVKSKMTNAYDIDNGIRFADGTEVLYDENISQERECIATPTIREEISLKTACAVLTIDTNGKAKGPNISYSSNKDHGDTFEMLLYNDKIVPIPNSVEENIINNAY